jgi:hypothetical protein
MPATKLVKFDSLGGVPCYYAKSNAGYGDLSKCKKSRVRKLNPMFLAKTSAMVQEINWVCYGALGQLRAITSGGAWVPESDKRGPNDWHVQGRAFDLGGLHWDGHILTCLDVAHPAPPGRKKWWRKNLLLYLSVESVMRKAWGIVLGVHFNRAHWNHFHFDPSRPRGYKPNPPGYPKTYVRYLQEVLTNVWLIGCGVPDGDEGPKTRKAIKAVRRELSIGPLTELNNWLQFLTVTSLKAIQLRESL